ncbi:OpgC domain-containing protein [Caulobacter endophyticus]|uniref:OpgC domain-containing protein n=1 Tax=Caulobacter endophyticus TaxID=2172652 RepID=UPI00240F9481|nr:OpgC domain-containing protein [Caulobacter endophyticus]MDG2531700.1 OpgC domain-containing protein [Caulobacter endophyticus]
MSGRIHLIDAVRGYCLVNIFVNHIGAGVLNHLSPSNVGFSDSAELFVFLAGMSAYLSSSDLSPAQRLGKFWRRAGGLYLCNLALIALSLCGLLMLGRFVDPALMRAWPVLDALASNSVAVDVAHLAGLRQSVGFSMVLRLYVALMLVAPLLVWAASRRWWWAVALALPVWALAGHFKLVLHESLTGAPLALTILPWTLIFACGVATAAALKQGVRLPRSSWLVAAALAVVLSYGVLILAAPQAPAVVAWAAGRNEHFWLGASKTFQSPLRVLHALSLVYLAIALARAPVLRLLHAVGADNVLTRLGRRSLPVFVASSVYATLANELVNLVNLRWGIASPVALATEAALVGAGLAGMAWIAGEGPARLGRALAALRAAGAPAEPVRP